MEEPEEVTFQFLREITHGFSEEWKVGEGAFGAVYKGVSTDGKDVAVKILRDGNPDLDHKQFRNEFYNLTKVKHNNIVQILGYCYEIEKTPVQYDGRTVLAEKTHRALCFEFVHNGSLQKNLSDKPSGLDWHTRYQIIKGTCEGLKYIHKDLGEPLLHLDLKPDNILLDKNMMPKIADFGLSKIFGHQIMRTTQSPLGTLGFQPPEYIERGEISEKFDIFSLGVTIIKIVAGPDNDSKYPDMPSNEFIDQVLRVWMDNWRRTCSSGLLESCCRQLKTCTEIALDCLEKDRQKRPDIVKIIDKLNEFEPDIDEPSQKRCNDIFFGMTMHNNEMSLTKGHRTTNAQHQQSNFVIRSRSNETESYSTQKTSLDAGKELIVGREEKKKGIASSLASMSEKIIIFPICGIGGIGKTTFVRLIYNDANFKHYSQVWVYVSPRFDLYEIGNSIISQLSGKLLHLSGKQNQSNELELIKNCLAKLISSKKILIVLDDLWEDNTIQLVDLKNMLNPGDSSKMIVLVTTRNEEIAKKICCNIESYKIDALTDEMCWDIIMQKSDFEVRHDKERLVLTGKDIARKCGGVALAAQTLGSMLWSMKFDEWMKVKDSDTWNETISEDNSLPNHVLASLKLSYMFSMDDCLKSCFTYCAMFPKGQEIVKFDLIHQWISLGFLKSTGLSSTLQLCEKYITCLLGLTFLQHSMSPTTYQAYGEHDTVFTMHDLVHGLAISLLGDKILDQSKQGNTDGSSCRYALLTDSRKPLESWTSSPAGLTALCFLDCWGTELYGAAFEPAEFLRVLDLRECLIQRLPDSIGNLKQLGYLNAPTIRYRMVPECITKLSNLRYLSLRGSFAILTLPESIGEMKGLVHLDLCGCRELGKLPESFRNLKSLEHLDFTNCKNMTGVSQCLASFTKLQHLNLSDCKSIGDLPRELGSLTELQYLNMSESSYFSGNKFAEAEFLGSLTKLKYLNLSTSNINSNRSSANQWLINTSPEALVSLTELKYLNVSHNCFVGNLPPSFGNLCNLVHLDLSYCYPLRGLPGALNRFTKLQYLDLYKCSGFDDMEWLEDAFVNLGELQHLNLGGCIGNMYYHPYKINRVLGWICTLTNLEYLSLRKNDTICSIPETLANLRKLHTLDLSSCNSLQRLPASISEIDSLKFLYTKECWELDRSTLPQHFVAHTGVDESSSYLLQYSVGGHSAKLSRLEKVKSAKKANTIKLVGKTDITELELDWTRDAKRFVEDAELLKELEPPYSISIFRLHGYNSVIFPYWVMHIGACLPHLTSIYMWDLPRCKNLPPLGQLPNLEDLNIGGMDSIKKIGMDLYGGPGAFPQLKRFYIHGMKWLEDWNTANSSDEDSLNEIVFPCLSHILISDCPRLRFKQRLLLSMHHNLKLLIRRSDEVMLSSLVNIGHAAASRVTILEVNSSLLPLHGWTLLRHLPCLQHLKILNCCDLTCSSPDFRQGHLTHSHVNRGRWHRPSTRERRSRSGNVGSFSILPCKTHSKVSTLDPRPRFSTRSTRELCDYDLTSLTQLKIHESEEWKPCGRIMSPPEGLGGLASLKVLEICCCESIKILLESIQQPTCLQTLIVEGCERITSLPEGLGGLVSLPESIQTLPESIQHLTCLQRLIVKGCKSIVSLPEGLGGLVSLTVLWIIGCESIQTLPESIQHLTCLYKLVVEGCKSIVSLPEGLGGLASLTVLKIYGCEGIRTLPDTIEQLTRLQKLFIRRCDELAQWCKSETETKLAHVRWILVDMWIYSEPDDSNKKIYEEWWKDNDEWDWLGMEDNDEWDWHWRIYVGASWGSCPS